MLVYFWDVRIPASCEGMEAWSRNETQGRAGREAY
jgi:hypothetical protein